VAANELQANKEADHRHSVATDGSRKPLRGIVPSSHPIGPSILNLGGSAPQQGKPKFGQNLCKDSKTGFYGSNRQLNRWSRDSAKPPAVRVRFSSERYRSNWNHCFTPINRGDAWKFF